MNLFYPTRLTFGKEVCSTVYILCYKIFIQACVSEQPGRRARARLAHPSANLQALKWTVGRSILLFYFPSSALSIFTLLRCGRPSNYPLNGQDCAVWICDGAKSAFNPIGHWTCMGFCQEMDSMGQLFQYLHFIAIFISLV